ncbi:Lon protease [Frankliniella fusca]|uniref:Lon protease n=1 Tax=Frankliniella fusca TaxID=407009 RepID=A0AAE1GY13_9NEOP|nr:Lon protease [Frankliniella fusca]
MEIVTYRVWMKDSKYYHLEKVVKPIQEFIDIFMELLGKLVTHHFVTKKQSAYYQHLKESIQEGEALVICDFAENYTCVMQNEVQGYHWTDEQITLHPFVAYYYTAARDLKHVCYVSVTDHKKHVTASFHAFQKKFVQFSKNRMAEDNVTCEKIFYFSDGSSAQYKNTSNVKNICMHEIDFEGIAVEWHYFASCHGKGPCDGCGGICKRCAKRASLQGELIRNASDFFEWANKPGRFPNISIELVTVEEVQASIAAQAERLKKIVTVTGVASYHAVIPQSESSVLLKRHSDSNVSVLSHSHKVRYFVPWDEIGAFILAVKADTWCLAKVIGKEDTTKQLSVIFLTPPGRAKSFRMTDTVHHIIPWNQVLTCTTPGHKKVYTVPASDKNAADKELQLYLELNGTGQPPTAGEQEEEDVDDPDSETDN